MSLESLVTAELPRPFLFQAYHHVTEAARILAGGAEPGLHRELLRVAQELRERERLALDLGDRGEVE